MSIIKAKKTEQLFDICFHFNGQHRVNAAHGSGHIDKDITAGQKSAKRVIRTLKESKCSPLLGQVLNQIYANGKCEDVVFISHFIDVLAQEIAHD